MGMSGADSRLLHVVRAGLTSSVQAGGLGGWYEVLWTCLR